MKQILDNMSSDQTGVVPGRYIGENTTLIYTLMQYTKENNTPGLLDSEKPLILSHGILIKHYYCFYFGPSFKDGYHFTFRYSIYSNTSWIFIIFFQAWTRSRWPYFNMTWILAIKIFKNDNDVKGIKVGNSVYLISQYTVDTALILYGSEKSLKVDLDELQKLYFIEHLG